MEHNETKNVVLINIDKISVISIDDIIDELISKFTEKVKDTITFNLFGSFTYFRKNYDKKNKTNVHSYLYYLHLIIF